MDLPVAMDPSVLARIFVPTEYVLRVRVPAEKAARSAAVYARRKAPALAFTEASSRSCYPAVGEAQWGFSGDDPKGRAAIRCSWLPPGSWTGLAHDCVRQWNLFAANQGSGFAVALQENVA